MGWSNQAVQLIVLTESSGFSGLFGYSPSPGPGNLAFSLAASPGTDPYGNAYSGPGVFIYGSGAFGVIGSPPDEGASIQIYQDASDPLDGTLSLNFPSGRTDETSPAALFTLAAEGEGGQDYLVISAAQCSETGDTFQLWLGASDDTSQQNPPYFALTAVNANLSPIFGDNLFGFSFTGTIDAPKPGDVLAPETWHVATLAAGWSAGSGGGYYGGIRYQLDATRGVLLNGTVTTTEAVTSSGVPVATLNGSGYVPAFTGIIPAMAIVNGTFTSAWLVLRGNTVTCYGPTNTAGNTLSIYLDGRVPLT